MKKVLFFAFYFLFLCTINVAGSVGVETIGDSVDKRWRPRPPRYGRRAVARCVAANRRRTFVARARARVGMLEELPKERHV